MYYQHCILSSVVCRSCYILSHQVTENKVVVLTFKIVYTLETKRRHNEKKIIAVYLEMKDMMSALLRCVTILLVAPR